MKNILTLFFTIFLVNTSAYAFEKSGFFIGIQGSILNQQRTNTDTNYNVEVTRNTSGTTTVSGSTTSKGWFGGGWFSDKSGSFSTVATSNVYMSIKSFFSQDISIKSDSPYSFGGTIGYKKIFQQSINAKQFVGNGFNQNAMGMRYYVNFDISGKGKYGKYSSQTINGNIDVLYNLFPQYNYWDFGFFAGISVGYVRHKAPLYEVKGLDYGLNFGVRWTINKRHNIELFGRMGLSSLERRTKNNQAEHYYFSDLSSSVENPNENGDGIQIDYDVESPGQDKIYVGVIKDNQIKTSVDATYGNDGKVYYKNSSSGEYVIINGEVKSYVSTEHQGQDRYSHAYVTENGKTSQYYWDYSEDGASKKIYLSSSQDTYGGGTASQVIKSEQILKSRPIDTIEEFRNPFRFGIRYTFTF